MFSIIGFTSEAGDHPSETTAIVEMAFPKLTGGFELLKFELPVNETPEVRAAITALGDAIKEQLLSAVRSAVEHPDSA